MAVDKLVDSTQLDADLTSVANAIRTKGGTSASLAFPNDFVSAVQAIPTGGVTPTGTKNITANGTGIDVYSYQYADVAVPNSYSQSDEGKVVSNGALVAQTSATYTTNDTYDTTLVNSVTVNVASGGFAVTDLIERSNITGDVTYTGNVTDLPIGAFAKTSITSFTSSVITGNTEGSAFRGCTSLTTADLPNFTANATNKAGYMFYGCTALTSVNVPKYARSGSDFFHGCTSLETLVLPKVDYTLQGYFASGCTSLKKVDLGGGFGGNIGAGNIFSNTGINLLILRRTTDALSLNNLNNFANSPMASNGTGGTIYVPSALKATYQSASNWSSLNVTWESIEGSTYETHYVDGTVIPT